MGPPGMSGPIEFGLGPPRFGNSQAWDLLGCQALWSQVPWDLGLPRAGSRNLQGWAPWGQFWDHPGLAPSRMRSGTPPGLGSAGTGVGSQRVRPHGDRFGTSQGIGPCRNDRCKTS